MTNLITQLPDLISGDIANDTMKPVVVESERTGEHTTTPTTPYYNMELGAGEAITNHKEGLADEFNDEENDELQSIAQSIVSSVLTADGIHDPVGFTIVCFVILIGDMSRGVMFPSMWPLVLELGGTQVTLGYSVASFSFGRILVSPLFGSWSVTYGYTKTLLLSCAILFFGAFLYSQIQNVGRIDFLILCQTILGIGSGTLGVTRAFVAEVTAHRSRTTYMAWTTAVQYAGFAMTPFIGALFNKTLANTDIQLG